MDDEIDDMLSTGEINADTANDLSYWMSLTIGERNAALIEYEEEAKRWQEYLDESYSDWATR